MKKEERKSLPLQKIARHYWGYAKNYPLLVCILLVAPIFGEIFDILPQYALKDIINTLSKTSGAQITDVLFASLITLFYFVTAYKFLQFFAFRFLSYAQIEMETRVMKKMLEDAFVYIHGHSVQFFQDQFVGSLVKQITRYADAFESIVDQVTWSFIPIIAQFIIGQYVLSSIHWMFGLAMGIWTFFFVLGSIYFASKKSHYDIMESEASSRLSGHLADSISNVLTVKVFAGFSHENEVFQTRTQELYEKQRKKWYFSTYGDAFQGFSMILMETILLWLCLHLWKSGVVTPGDVVLILGASIALFRRLWGLGRSINKMYSSFTYAHEMMELLGKPQEILDVAHAKSLSVRGGTICFQDVSFGYGDRTLMKDFQFSIRAGERVALVGHSGAGKSTLIKLLLRFHDPLSGHIYIDGQDIGQVSQDSLHRAIAFVPQEPVLFHRTIGENISYARPNATKAEIIHAAKLAHAHEFISSFHDGYDTYVGERGVKLSGGERQRIAIARAILSRAPILILDEATSALDSESEKLIKDALHTLMQGKTTIVVAHRLSTIMEMDRIVVLEQGNILEEGAHEELLARDGLYHKLWSIQSGGFMGE